MTTEDWVRPVLVQGSYSDGRVLVEDVAGVANRVMGGEIVVIKNAASRPELRTLREQIVTWSKSVPSSNPDRLSAVESWWRRDVDPPQSVSKHIFDSFCFVVTNDQDPIGPACRDTFSLMAHLWRDLTGQTGDFEPDAQGRSLRPQAIHYPAGGGYFEWHEHSVDPQRIGLILSLSERGKDHQKGSTVFRTEQGVVGIDDDHDMGDICLFRYDLPHAIEPVDPADGLDWDRGRWTMVLPLI